MEQVVTTTDARAQLRKLGRKVKRLPNGRYQVAGVWPDVRECDLIVLAQGLEATR